MVAITQKESYLLLDKSKAGRYREMELCLDGMSWGCRGCQKAKKILDEAKRWKGKVKGDLYKEILLEFIQTECERSWEEKLHMNNLKYLGKRREWESKINQKLEKDYQKRQFIEIFTFLLAWGGLGFILFKNGFSPITSTILSLLGLVAIFFLYCIYWIFNFFQS